MTTDDYWPFHTENDFLHLIIEQGVIGLGLWLSMFVQGMLCESLRQPQGDRAIRLTLFFVIALFGLHQQPDRHTGGVPADDDSDLEPWGEMSLDRMNKINSM